MRITFLGTSHGIPEPNRRCSCTMIEVDNNIYFIDMGVMALYDIITFGKKVEDIKGIFITHLHGDHSNGLFSLVDLINWYYTSCDPKIYLPDLKSKDVFEAWLGITKAKNRDLDFNESFEGVIYFDDKIKITAQQTQHCSRSFSYLVECNGKKVLFSGDLRNPSHDFPHKLCEDKVDLAILEVAHFPATEYSQIIEKYNFEHIIFNHYAPRNIPSIQSIKESFRNTRIDISNDLMQITL